MAKTILLKDPKTGVMKEGLYGFSWTTFFFGGFPALFRGDIVIGVCLFILNLITFGLAGLIWAFVYNKHYTLRLIEKGYQFADTEENTTRARQKLNIAPPAV